MKYRMYAHICPPEYVLRFERAERRALEIAARRYDPPKPIERWKWANNPANPMKYLRVADIIEDLPVPSPGRKGGGT